MARKTALITGITGQDGSYLAELLLTKGYRVCGMVRRASTENFQRIDHLRDRLELFQADLLDQTSMARMVADIQPDEVYNLAAMSFVPTSWQQPVLTAEFTAVGVTRLLDALRQRCPQARRRTRLSFCSIRDGALRRPMRAASASTRRATSCWLHARRTRWHSPDSRAMGAMRPARGSCRRRLCGFRRRRARRSRRTTAPGPRRSRALRR